MSMGAYESAKLVDAMPADVHAPLLASHLKSGACLSLLKPYVCSSFLDV